MSPAFKIEISKQICQRRLKGESGGVVCVCVINKAKHHPVVCMWSPGSGQLALKVKTIGCFSHLLCFVSHPVSVSFAFWRLFSFHMSLTSLWPLVYIWRVGIRFLPGVQKVKLQDASHPQLLSCRLGGISPYGTLTGATAACVSSENCSDQKECLSVTK